MHTRIQYSYIIAILMLLSGILSFQSNAGNVQAKDYHSSCEAIVIPVALTPGAQKKYSIHASLCLPAHKTDTLLITYHGNSYAQYYWNFPYQPETYSFVDAMNRAGYAVLNMDRLPVDHDFDGPNPAQPPSKLVTIASDTYALHQIVQELRAGSIGGKAFSRILLVGHSLGGYMSWQAGESYPHDFDGFIITGAMHINSTINTNKVIPLLAPATQNPKFAKSGLDAGYYAYKPNTRSVYYYTPNADPKVISTDNQLMQVTVLQELIDGLNLQKTYVSKSIHVPVLLVLGQYDLFACAPDALPNCTQQTVLQEEHPYYSAQACLQADVIPNAGHDLNLQRNAQLWYSDASHWINSFVVHHSSSCGTRT